MIDSIHAVKQAVFDKVYKTGILTSCVATEREKFTLTLRRLMSHIYGAPILDVSRSHTTTQYSR